MEKDNVKSVPYETINIDGIDVFHTYRGHNHAVEVYTFQDGRITYSLYKHKDNAEWACDWTASYNRGKIDLAANASDEQAMLRAFAQMLKTREKLHI